MNKLFNINLGGYPFSIDEDAYTHLKRYLKTIHDHFRHSEGYEEITGDIETRLAELFHESLAGRPIVTEEDVIKAIKTMGTPEEFGAETAGQEAGTGTESETNYRTGKRLFRNEDDKVIAGVCSGISAYFGISDPLWVRLAFVIIVLTAGFGIPLYLILWAIIPKAKTAADYLAMRGEPINVSNIARVIETEARNLSDKISEIGQDWSPKKKVTPENLLQEPPLRKGFLY